MKLACAVLLAALPALAQGFSGRYACRTSDGDLILTLTGKPPELTGELQLPLGLAMRLRGAVENGAARGKLISDGREADFELERRGPALWLRILEAAGGGEVYAFLPRASEEAPGPAPVASRQAPPAPARASGDAAPPGAGPGIAGDSAAGFRFTVPAGWTAVRGPSGFVLAGERHGGLILVIPVKLEEPEDLRARVMEGIVEGDDTRMIPAGEPWSREAGAWGAKLSGRLDRRPAKAVVLGVAGPYRTGALVVAGAPSEKFTPEYEAWAEAIARSLRFSRPAPSPPPAWEARLAGRKLSRQPGYGERRELSLCPDGAFVAVGLEAPRLTGKWGVAMPGAPVLELSFPGGRTIAFPLDDEGGQVLLAGERWLVTMAECGPSSR